MLSYSQTKATTWITMTIIKNSGWNRLFHPQQIKRNKARAHFLRQFLEPTLHQQSLENIQNASSLMVLFHLHKSLWRAGYRNDFIGPSKYGLFRCKRIEMMTPNDVFLGAHPTIFGCLPHTILYYEDHKYNTELYNQVMYEYKQCLILNINEIYKDYVKELKELENNLY